MHCIFFAILGIKPEVHQGIDCATISFSAGHVDLCYDAVGRVNGVRVLTTPCAIRLDVVRDTPCAVLASRSYSSFTL